MKRFSVCRCPPRTFLPALCKVFLDERAPDNVLEVTARAITYYLDVSAECARRIIAIEGAIRALCARLEAADMSQRASRDLAEQCIKVLELICSRDSMAIFEAGGLTSVLQFVHHHGDLIHRDTLHSAMSVISRLCSRVEPADKSMPVVVESLTFLLKHEDQFVRESSLKCLASVADRYSRRGNNPTPFSDGGLIDDLLCCLSSAARDESQGGAAGGIEAPTIVTLSISLLSILCRGSPHVTHVRMCGQSVHLCCGRRVCVVLLLAW